MTRHLFVPALLLALASLAPGGETEDWRAIEELMKNRPTAEAFEAHWQEVARRCEAFLAAHPTSDHAAMAHYVAGRQRLATDPAAALAHLEADGVAAAHPYSVVLAIGAHRARGDEEAARKAFAALEAMGEPAARYLAAGRKALGEAPADEAEAPAGPVVVGQAPPGLEGTAIDGRVVDLAALRGKVVLIDFWATWCGPCKREMPNVVAAYETYHERGLEVIGVSLDRKLDPLTAYVEANGIAWPQLCDLGGWKSELARSYGVGGIPFLVVVGRDGTVVAVDPRGARLVPAIEAALAAEAGE